MIKLTISYFVIAIIIAFYLPISLGRFTVKNFRIFLLLQYHINIKLFLIFELIISTDKNINFLLFIYNKSLVIYFDLKTRMH